MTKDITDSDVNDCCGAVAEIGSIIRPDDTALTFSVTCDTQQALDQKRAEIESYLAEKFKDNEDASFVEQEGFCYLVTLNFGCTAEKMIFEMNLRHLLA
ncbi:MAG: hypothetical protein ACI86X_001926 [Moritella sp.]|jgi:uncharacterized protein YfcZ (UPF0381/DUF406 family)